jgi:hypothetical protein
MVYDDIAEAIEGHAGRLPWSAADADQGNLDDRHGQRK